MIDYFLHLPIHLSLYLLIGFFTPYNPEAPSPHTGDEGNFISKDK
jgi:hypothetical protein